MVFTAACRPGHLFVFESELLDPIRLCGSRRNRDGPTQLGDGDDSSKVSCGRARIVR